MVITLTNRDDFGGVGIERAGTGNLPAFHYFQTVWYAMPFLLAPSERFIILFYAFIRIAFFNFLQLFGNTRQIMP